MEIGSPNRRDLKNPCLQGESGRVESWGLVAGFPRTLITVGGAGLTAALAGINPPLASAIGAGSTAGAAGAGAAAAAAGAAAPRLGSGGIPPGPSTYGWDPADLLEFDPATHPWGRHLRCLVPPAPRIAPFAPTQAHPDLDPGGRLSTLSLHGSSRRRARPFGVGDRGDPS